MKQAKMNLECLRIGLRSTVVGAPHSQNLFEHQQRRETLRQLEVYCGAW